MKKQSWEKEFDKLFVEHDQSFTFICRSLGGGKCNCSRLRKKQFIHQIHQDAVKNIKNYLTNKELYTIIIGLNLIKKTSGDDLKNHQKIYLAQLINKIYKFNS